MCLQSDYSGGFRGLRHEARRALGHRPRARRLQPYASRHAGRRDDTRPTTIGTPDDGGAVDRRAARSAPQPDLRRQERSASAAGHGRVRADRGSCSPACAGTSSAAPTTATANLGGTTHQPPGTRPPTPRLVVRPKRFRVLFRPTDHRDPTSAPRSSTFGDAFLPAFVSISASANTAGGEPQRRNSAAASTGHRAASHARAALFRRYSRRNTSQVLAPRPDNDSSGHGAIA